MPAEQAVNVPDTFLLEGQPNASDSPLENSIGLCLSGGGYRAMIFHVGVIWRLNELGYLPKLARISSVSGGSITAGLLGMKWSKLTFNAQGVATNLVEEFVQPLRAFAKETVDVWAVGIGALNPLRSISEEVQGAYSKHLFGDATLQDLPDSPRFVINATNIQSGVLFRFSKPYQGDYRIGRILKPATPLAQAVAASSAFPPILSPCVLTVNPANFEADDSKIPADLKGKDFRSDIFLADGGVYDNLGLETVWKRCKTVLVSDAGQKIGDETKPATDWPRHAVRVLDIEDNQVRSLRKRLLIAAYESKDRLGAYWGIRTDIADYKLATALSCPHTKALTLAAIPTRLANLEDALQQRLINWGYAVCDAGMRAHVLPDEETQPDFPYPGGI
jgi:NTE family protein